MAAPVIGGEGSEALCAGWCWTLCPAGCASSRSRQRVRDDPVMCEVTIPQDHPHAAQAASEDGFCAWWLRSSGWGRGIEYEKGIRWMPWHQEAMKDVARCEKPWGAASRR
jgi:hypothetical protein